MQRGRNPSGKSRTPGGRPLAKKSSTANPPPGYIEHGRSSRGLGTADRAIIKENVMPKINFNFVAAFMVVVFLGVLVGISFAAVFIAFTYTKEEGTTYRSVKAIGDTMTRAANITGEMGLAIPPVNWTLVVDKTFPKSEDEWANITNQASRTATKALKLVDRAEEKDFIGKLADLSSTIVGVVTDSKFVRYVTTGVDHAYWVMEVLQSDDAVTLAGFARETARNVVGAFSAESPEGRQRREFVQNYFLPENVERVVDAFVEGKTEVVHTIREGKTLLRRVEEHNLVAHLSKILKEAGDHDVIGKTVEIYNQAEHVEHKIEDWAKPVIRVVFDVISDMREDRVE